MSRISIAPEQGVHVSATPTVRKRIVSDVGSVTVDGGTTEAVLEPGDEVTVSENVTLKTVEPAKAYVLISEDNTVPVVDGTAESLTDALVFLGIVQRA